MRVRLLRYSRRSLIVFIVGGILLLAGGGAVVAAYLGGGGPSASDQTSSINLSKGLVGWYKLDGNAKDSTPYGNDGTVYGSTVTADRNNNANRAYSFNGTSSDYVNIPDASQQSPGSGSYSISLWFKESVAGTLDGSILYNKENLYEASAGGGYFTYAWEPHWAWDGGTSFPISVGTWYHAVVVYDGTNQYLYKDGTLVSSRAQTGAIGSNTNRLAFATRGTSGGGSSPFNGAVDDVRMYNRALSAAEVAALYNQYDSSSNAAKGENGLVGWWKMDGNAKDSSPYGDNGLLQNGPGLTTDRHGAANKAYSFNGSNQWIRFPDNTALDVGLGSMSWSGWFKTTTASSFIYRKSDGCNDNGFILETVSGGKIEGYLTYYSSGTPCSGSSVATAVVSPGTTYLDGNWHSATVVLDRNADTLTLYLDGQYSTSTSASAIAGINMTAANYPAIGSSYGGANFFNGSLSDVRVYDRALAASEVSNLYTSYNSQLELGGSGANGSVSLGKGLVGDWPFNGNAKDITPYSNNGTINGATLTTDRKGRASSAYAFNGSSYIDMFAPSSLNTGNNISVNAWFYSTSNSSYQPIVAKVPSGYATGWEMANSNGVYRATLRPTPVNVSAGSITLNQWHMITFTYSSTTNTLTLYADGIALNTAAGSVTLNTAADLEVGMRAADSAKFNGSIDDVRVWNRALSQAEVTALYQEYR